MPHRWFQVVVKRERRNPVTFWIKHPPAMAEFDCLRAIDVALRVPAVLTTKCVFCTLDSYRRRLAPELVPLVALAKLAE